MDSAKTPTPTVAHLIEKHAQGKLVVSSVGAGYVGAMTSIVLASINPDVTVIVCDISEALIKKWNDHTLPFFEPGLKENFEVSRSHL
jgi:UDP-glucose 6-dehydrogenase